MAKIYFMDKSWRQKIQDSNSRYNTIEKLKVNGEQGEDKEVSKREIISFYTTMYKENVRWRSIYNSDCPMITAEDMEWIQRPFIVEEIEDTT